MRDKPFWTIALIWIAVMLPAVFLGYGSDLDAWRVASTAGEIWRTSTYLSSRSTGFPLHELFMTPLVHFGGWILSNLFSLLSGLILLFLLWRYAKEADLHHPLLFHATLAFLPIVMKNSGSTMDYIPALALMMGAWLSLRRGLWLPAAILLGLACGFRPTSFVFFPALAFYSWQKERNWRPLVKMALITSLVALICFIPFLLTYGRFFVPNYFIQPDWITRFGSIILHSLSLLGIVPSLFLFGFLTFRYSQMTNSGILADGETRFHLLNLLLWSALFIYLPEEPEYLLPLLPSLWYLVDRCANRRQFLLLAIVMMSYHFVRLDLIGGVPGQRRLQVSVDTGLTIQDVQDRRFKLATRRMVTEYQASQPTILLFGAEWIPVLNPCWQFDETLEMHRQKGGNLFLSPRILDEKKLIDLTSRGFRLVAWRVQMREYQRRDTAFFSRYVGVIDDLDDFFAAPIPGAPLRHR